ncbi:MAG: putative exported protein [Bacteroidetes bacterium]|nr:putative exported protein [Bacteroidota bacterium]
MKRYYSLFFLVVSAAASMQAQITEFIRPWNDTTRAIIIDAYYQNDINWNKMAADKRVAAVIHKASEGLKTDSKYSERRDSAKSKGYLWGSYHLAKSGDAIAQADHYLSITGNDSSEFLALDLETIDSVQGMTLLNAEKFIERVHEKTGRYPFVYCNKDVRESIVNSYADTSVFAKCGLWYARFRNDISDYDKKLWPSYSLWQFSCELNCSTTGKCWYNVPGTDKNMDINVYNGTVEELRKKWPAIR